MKVIGKSPEGAGRAQITRMPSLLTAVNLLGVMMACLNNRGRIATFVEEITSFDFKEKSGSSLQKRRSLRN